MCAIDIRALISLEQSSLNAFIEPTCKQLLWISVLVQLLHRQERYLKLKIEVEFIGTNILLLFLIKNENTFPGLFRQANYAAEKHDSVDVAVFFCELQPQWRVDFI